MLRKAFGQYFPERNSSWFLILFALVVGLGLFLRTYNIKNTLLFHFDQGYHGLAIKNIWDNKKLTLLGHKTDVEGIFHSSLFYYLMLPVYLLSNWNPAYVSTILATLDALAIIFIYLTARELFNHKVGITSSLLYAVSYSAISYARWLSNVTLIPLLSSVAFFFLAKTEKGNSKYFTLAVFIAGVIAQLNGAIGFFLIPLFLLYALTIRKKIIKSKKDVVKYCFWYLLPSSGLILFDLRNNFLVTRSILNHFTKGKTISFSSNSLLRVIDILGNQTVNLLSYKIPILAICVILIITYSYKKIWTGRKEEFLRAKQVLVAVLFYLLLLFLYRNIHDFFIVAIIPLAVIVVGWSLYYVLQEGLLKYVSAVALSAIVLLNLYHWRGFLEPNFNLVPIGTRNLITLEDRKKAADFMYNKAEGKPFRTVIYIIPYFQEQPWDYVFGWYAKSKYGYLPSDKAEKVFLIYEPDYDFSYRLDSWLEKAKIEYGEAKSNFKSNSLTIEEREK